MEHEKVKIPHEKNETPFNSSGVDNTAFLNCGAWATEAKRGIRA